MGFRRKIRDAEGSSRGDVWKHNFLEKKGEERRENRVQAPTSFRDEVVKVYQRKGVEMSAKIEICTFLSGLKSLNSTTEQETSCSDHKKRGSRNRGSNMAKKGKRNATGE